MTINQGLRPILAGLVLSAGAGATGCDDPPVSASSPVISDSAAVRIIHSPVPTGALDDWAMTAEPITTIGSTDGDDGLYRVFSAASLADDRVIVSNSGTNEIRTYDAAGVLLGAFGREGMGPGEFSGLSSMRILKLTDDSIAVMDVGNNRTNVYSRSGESLGTLTFRPVAGYGRPDAVGPLPGGDWVVTMPVGSGALRGEVGDRIEMTRAFFRYTPDGESENRITTIPTRPRMVNDLGGGATHFPFVPLTPEPAYAIRGDALLVNGADGESEVREVSSDGTLRAIYRWSAPRVSVSAIWDRFAEVYLEGAGERRRPAYERLVQRTDLELPEFVPVIQEIIVDALDHIWVGRYRLPWSTARSWHVLDPEGVWIGDIDTPEGLTVFEIGEDYVLGRAVDELGVETVLVYGLSR